MIVNLLKTKTNYLIHSFIRISYVESCPKYGTIFEKQ